MQLWINRDALDIVNEFIYTACLTHNTTWKHHCEDQSDAQKNANHGGLVLDESGSVDIRYKCLIGKRWPHIAGIFLPRGQLNRVGR